MREERYDIGMIGLGVMGHNLVLNIADHGFSAIGYDKDPNKNAMMHKDAGPKIGIAKSMQALVMALKSPRAVMVLVPAGPPVDAVIRDLLPHLSPGDIIIDAGNSHFTDTNLRAKMLVEKELRYLGVGISGGEAGARHGPSIMPGGPNDAYERVRPIFEAVAAHVDGEACVTYLGPGSAGHYVKMVHNGIEYALMQLIAESYDLMKRGLGLNDDELHDVYRTWNGAELQSYLIEITAEIFSMVDTETGKRLIDVILDVAKQKGTGKWTSQDAMDNNMPLPNIDVAVAMRDLTRFESVRKLASQALPGPAGKLDADRATMEPTLRRALYMAMILSYIQGMHLLKVASDEYRYDLDLEAVARIWRGGCIIRAAVLEDIRAAFQRNAQVSQLLLDPHLADLLSARHQYLRTVVSVSAQQGLPVPGFMAALGYYDAFRSAWLSNAWLPANLIQAQRDFFGAHTYERIDEKGVFHTRWE